MMMLHLHTAQLSCRCQDILCVLNYVDLFFIYENYVFKKHNIKSMLCISSSKNKTNESFSTTKSRAKGRIVDQGGSGHKEPVSVTSPPRSSAVVLHHQPQSLRATSSFSTRFVVC